MKLYMSHRSKTDTKVLFALSLISLSARKHLNSLQMTVEVNPKHIAVPSAPEILALFLFRCEGGFDQSSVLFTHYLQNKHRDETIPIQKAILPTGEKNTDVILMLSSLSKSYPRNYSKRGNERFQSAVRTAIISGTNPDLLSTSGTNINIQSLCQSIQRLHLSINDLLWSPVGILKSLSTKGSAPEGNEKRYISDSINLMFVVLGWSGDRPEGSIEVFDMSTQKWSFFQKETPFIRAYHGVALVGSYLYVVGGFNGNICLATTLCLNLRSRQWSRKSTMSIPRCYVFTIAFKGRIYAIGGHSGMNRLKTCEKFDPNKNKWSRISDMMYRRSDAAGAEINGKILVCGGFDGFHFHSTVETYDPTTDQWTLVRSLTHPRSGHSVISFNGHIYVLGGFNGLRRMREVERFNEEANLWETSVPMLIGRSNFCAVLLQQEIFVIGGYDGNGTISNVEKFDKNKMEWQRAPSLNIPRSAAGACLVKNSGSATSCALNELVPIVSTNVEEPSP